MTAFAGSRAARARAIVAALVVPAVLVGCVTGTVQRANTRVAAQRAFADSVAKAAIAAEARIDPAALDPAVVGVTPFYVEAADSVLIALGYALSDLMLGDLATVRRLTVVDRLRLDAVLRELVYVQRSFVDSTRAPRVGRLIGAGRLVIGMLSPSGDPRRKDFVVSVRVLDTRTGRFADSLTNRAGLGQMLDAEKALVLRTLNLLGIEPTPAEREGIAQRQTRNLSALVAFGRGVQADVRGYADSARMAYAEAVDADPAFAVARQKLDALPRRGGDPLVQRVIGVAGERVTSAAPTRVAEAVDAPIGSVRDIIRLLLTVRLP